MERLLKLGYRKEMSITHDYVYYLTLLEHTSFDPLTALGNQIKVVPALKQIQRYYMLLTPPDTIHYSSEKSLLKILMINGWYRYYHKNNNNLEMLILKSVDSDTK